jgi:hypothetical protein
VTTSTMAATNVSLDRGEKDRHLLRLPFGFGDRGVACSSRKARMPPEIGLPNLTGGLGGSRGVILSTMTGFFRMFPNLAPTAAFAAKVVIGPK